MSHPQLSTRKHVSKHTYLVVSYMATGMCKRMAHYTHASLKATHVRTGVCFKQHDAVFRCLPVFRISEAPGWRQLSQQDTHAPLKATHVRECFLSNMMPQIAPVIRCLPVFRISEAPGWRLAVTTGHPRSSKSNSRTGVFFKQHDAPNSAGYSVSTGFPNFRNTSLVMGAH